MSGSNSKLIVGFITYGESTAKYLPYFLPSLMEQTYQGFKVIVIDNSEEQTNGNVRYIMKRYPDIGIEWAESNIGFARAYNRLIRRAGKSGAEYFCMLNPDILMEPDVLEKLVMAIEKKGEIGSVCPKILKWDFRNKKKTETIDSCGIEMRSGLRFIDLGQAQTDRGQYDNADILGPSGAAALYRLDALHKIRREGQYFDELMFMYKEDCDLAYRLFLAGYKSRCVSHAVVYHDRSASGTGGSDMQAARNRKNKNRRVKEWSFLNQHIIFMKYWHLQNFRNKLAVLWYAIKMFVFVLLFERYLLKQYPELWRSKNKI